MDKRCFVAVRASLGVGVAVLLAACGGGGKDETDPGTPTRAVARVEITSGGAALLTREGEQRALRARALDADGQVVNVPIAWSSSRSASVAVDASGVLTAKTAAGSAQITAGVGAIVSPPLVAIVAQPVAGALLVSDEQVIGEPVETDSAAPPSPSNTYRVTLQGVAAPAPGSIVLGSGTKAVAGRVVAVQTTGSQHTVTLRPAPPSALFTNLRVQETFDLSKAPVLFDADVQARFDIKREGNRFTFTERPGTRGAVGSPSRKGALAAVGTSALPPFTDCTAEPEDLASISTALLPQVDAATFSITIAPDYDFDYHSASGLQRVIVKAEPQIEIETGLTAALAFEGTLSCQITLFKFVVPMSGPLAWIASGVVPVGVGFEFGGKVTVAQAKISGKVTAKAKARLGLDCVSGACGAVTEFSNATLETDPKLETPNLGTQPRFEPSLALFGFMEVNLGNPVFTSLQFKAFKARVSGTIEGSFALDSTQIADTDYRSNYSAALGLKAGAGLGFSGALALLGLDDIVTLEYSESFPKAASPTGSVAADRASFVAGDTVKFTVTLDDTSVNFFPALGPYNVQRVLLLRKPTLGAPVEIDSLVAAPGQKSFSFTWVAPDSGKTEQFYAFVVTKLLPLNLLALEIGQASGTDPEPGVRLRSGGFVDESLCETLALGEPFGDPNDTSFARHVDRGAGAPFACNSSVAGASASANGSGSASGTTYTPTGLTDPGVPITQVIGEAQHQAQSLTSVQPVDGRRLVAEVFARAERRGVWHITAGAQPVAYTLVATLNAQPGGVAVIGLRDPAKPDQEQIWNAICPGVLPSNTIDDWWVSAAGACVGATHEIASFAYSGVLAAGASLWLYGISGAGWGGRREVSPELVVGPQGSRTANSSFSFTLTFSPVQ